MPYQHLFLLISIIAVTTLGCKKDFSDQECRELKDAMATNNIDAVKTIITQSITRLPSQNNTQQNLDALATSLSGQFTISAEVLCFGCIQTLPEQSEIKLSFISSGSPIYKIIDISYSPDNKMKFVNMHE